MATTGRRISEGVVESIEREKGAAEEINHGGPVFDRAAVQGESSVVETPAVETGGGTVTGSMGEVAAPVATRSAERPAVASTVVDGVLGGPGSSLVSAAPAASVPAVPSGSGLTPGVLSGRVSTQADSGYAPGAEPVRLASSDLSDRSYVQTEALQDQRDVRESSEQDDGGMDEKVQAQNVSKQRYVESKSEELVREAGSTEVPKPMNVLSRANRRFKESKKRIQERIKFALAGEKYHGSNGNAFNDTIFSLSTLMPDQVSIGSEGLREALRDPNSNLLDIVNDATGMNLDRESCLADISLLVDAINMSNIEVVFSKYPVNTKHSIQVRTLRAHYGRGIGLHPTQTKAYNADFDGDTGNLNFDQSNLKNYSRAMTHLIDSEGNPSIDPDFFPLDYLALEASGDKRDLVESMQERSFAWEPSVATRVADSYIDACNNGNWIGLLRKIDEIAGDRNLQTATNLKRNQLVSRILKSVYDYAIDRRGLNLRLEWASVVDSYEYVEPGPDVDPVVISLMDMVEEIAQGRPAPNFQEFTIFFNKQYGDLGESVGGKNVPFRLLADFAKAIKRTDLVTVGDPIFDVNKKGEKEEGGVVTLYDMWQFTCSAGVSKLISGRMHMGSHELAVSTYVKTQVRKLVPVPQYDTSGTAEAKRENEKKFRQWIKDFKREYNSQMRMLNVSQVRFRSGMMIDRAKLLRYDGFDKIDDKCAKAIVEVYGDMVVERVFPDTVHDYGRKQADSRENTNSGVINRYGKMTIAEFAMQNRLDWYSERVGKENVPKIQMINERISRNRYTPYDILMLVSDRRSKQFGEYNEKWLEATAAHVEIMKRIKNDVLNHDFNEYANDMLELLHLMSPRMFDHFGMDSPLSFSNSKWGKKLLECETESEFRSVLVSMTIEYRFSTASNIRKSIKEIKEAAVARENDAERIEAAESHYMQEMRQLASSSLAWETIVSETLGDTDGFRKLLKFKKIKRRNHEYKMDAADFWNSNSEETQFDLVNFLKSSADYETKVAVLADVIKYNTGIESIDVSHVIGMLAHDPDPLFAGSQFEMDNGIRSATDSVKDSIEKLTSYQSRSPEKIKKMADKVIEEAYEDKAAFEARLYRFATEPDYHVYVDTVFAADALSSIYEKAYSDSEKIKQQTLVNAFFECLSLQRNGGFYTHLQQTDNAVANVVGYDQLTPIDIVRILGDPSIELHGYDEFGTPCVYSRRALCGGDSIDDVLRYLQDHPRVALACRRHMACVNAGLDKKNVQDGSARLAVLNDANAGVTYTNKVFSLLNDRYRFLAIAALITPAHNDVGRNMAEKINVNIKNLCLFILDEAASGKNAQQIEQDIEDFFGIPANESLDSHFMKLRKEGAFDENDFDLPDYLAVENLRAEIVDEITECISIVQKSGIALRKVPESSFDRDAISIDKASMLAYYDARQQLCGARTAKMIQIEGSETKKNLMLKEYVRNRPDRYMTVTKDFSTVDLLKLSELTQSNIRAELERSEDGMLVIEVPEGWSPSDWTMEHSPSRTIGSVSKFLEVKREKGAETFNAKSKKFGDDGTQSIIKFFKYGTKAMLGRYSKNKTDDFWTVEDGIDLRKKIEGAGSKEAAIPILADALMEADARLGYIDMKKVFQKSDYYNRADLMLAEDVDENGNPIIRIRTLEQLAIGFRNRLSDEAVLSGDVDTVIAELAQLESVIGTSADPMNNPRSNAQNLDSVRIVSGFGSVARLERALRPYSSSTERNFKLVWDLFRQFGRDEMGDVVYRMPSREEIEDRSNKMFAQLKDQNVKNALKGIAYPNDKWVNGERVEDPNGSRDAIYDYLGRPQDEDFKLIPGPQSLVYFDGTNPKDRKTIEDCKKYGITAAFSDLVAVPSKYVEDAIVLDEGMVILPFFDMRLNGAVSEPISPAPGQFFFQENNVIVSVEETTYEIEPGDASGHATLEGLDKTHINFEGVEQFDIGRLFPNVLREDGQYVDENIKLCLCTKKEVVDHILTGEGTVDYGVLEGAEGDERARERYYIRLEEYADKVLTKHVDDDTSFIIDDDCRYDSIVGFVKLEIGNGTFAFAPIIPFHIEQSGKAPSKFKPQPPEIDDDTASYTMKWKFTDDVRNQYIKFFEGIGSSNKLIVDGGNPARSRNLANGTPVDILYSTASVSSRLFPINKRIHTLITMMMIPRIDSKYSYNFGDLDGAFPGEYHWIAEKLSAGELTLQDWSDIVRDNPNLQYHVDSDINRVVKWMVEKCVKPGVGYQTVSPSMLLSTHRTVNGVREIYQPTGTEFEAFMDSGYNFQNALMKFMHAMNPTLVPESIDDSSESTLFKPVNKGRNDADYGVLQMMVPHWTKEDGKYYEVAENVYISFGFFGDEFSGFKKVNYDAANRGLDDLNVSNNLDGFDLSQVMAFGRAGYSGVPSLNMLEVAEDNIMKSVDNEEIKYVHSDTSRILRKETYGKILALTGHRPTRDKKTGKSKLWGFNMSDPRYARVKQELAEYCRKHNIDTIVSGMALGFDQLGAQVAIENGLKLVAAVPVESQDSRWSDEQKEEYRWLLANADKIIIVNDGEYDPYMMQIRNQWMVNNSDSVFALWDGSEGGTGNCVKYAERRNKPIKKINPRDFD